MNVPSLLTPATPAARMGRPPIPDTLRNRIIAHALRGDTKYGIAKKLGISRPTVRRTLAAAMSFALEPCAA